MWGKHPGVRSDKQLTIGERAADLMRNGMGSWLFVGLFVGFMFLWMMINHHNGFDPYPFILLNLMLSTLAGLQGAILLIAAKRSDQVSSELAMHDHELAVANKAATDEILLKLEALTDSQKGCTCQNQ